MKKIKQKQKQKQILENYLAKIVRLRAAKRYILYWVGTIYT